MLQAILDPLHPMVATSRFAYKAILLGRPLSLRKGVLRPKYSHWSPSTVIP